MWIDVIITHLYSLVGLVVVTGYVPQIIKLANSTGRSLAISIPTFAMWAASAVISLLYGLLILRDWRFCVIESINVMGYATIIVLTVYNRYFRFPPVPLPGSLIGPLPAESGPDVSSETLVEADVESGLT